MENVDLDKIKNELEELEGLAESLTKIAKQSNLLALNAAIEAARVGESGKGFAVVAAEFRKLADSTAKLSQNIKNKIESLHATIEDTGEE